MTLPYTVIHRAQRAGNQGNEGSRRAPRRRLVQSCGVFVMWRKLSLVCVVMVGIARRVMLTFGSWPASWVMVKPQFDGVLHGSHLLVPRVDDFV